MANVKHGNLTPAPKYRKHLREWKRIFWKGERAAQNRQIVREAFA
jgi:hypothetical protein